MLWRLVGGAALLVVAGCVSTEERVVVPPSAPSEPPPIAAPAAPAEAARPTVNPSRQERFSWARSDGERISGNAELTAKARADLLECKADAPPKAAAGAGGEVCMKGRGYYVRAID